MALTEPRPWDLDQHRHILDGIRDADRPGMHTTTHLV
jgi:hypothetical protein